MRTVVAKRHLLPKGLGFEALSVGIDGVKFTVPFITRDPAVLISVRVQADLSRRAVSYVLRAAEEWFVRQNDV